MLAMGLGMSETTFLRRVPIPPASTIASLLILNAPTV